MENNLTWLLIADSSKARIFALHKARIFTEQNPALLKPIGNFIHNESRQKAMELTSDRQGEFGHATFSANTPAKTHEAEIFAHKLIAELEAARKKLSFRELILIAPPAFMGLLNKHMSHETKKLVSQTIEKDYTLLQGKELMQSLLLHF